MEITALTVNHMEEDLHMVNHMEEDHHMAMLQVVDTMDHLMVNPSLMAIALMEEAHMEKEILMEEALMAIALMAIALMEEAHMVEALMVEEMIAWESWDQTWKISIGNRKCRNCQNLKRISTLKIQK
jgi:glycerol-3-phosphate O-acyltransferase